VAGNAERRPCCLDPRGGVFGDEAVRGFNLQFLGCQKKNRRIGLTPWQAANGAPGRAVGGLLVLLSLPRP
jgi:hypothetical protein